MSGNSGYNVTKFRKEVGSDRNMGIKAVAKENVRDAFAAVPTHGGLKKDFKGTEQPRTAMKTVSRPKSY